MISVPVTTPSRSYEVLIGSEASDAGDTFGNFSTAGAHSSSPLLPYGVTGRKSC